MPMLYTSGLPSDSSLSSAWLGITITPSSSTITDMIAAPASRVDLLVFASPFDTSFRCRKSAGLLQ